MVLDNLPELWYDCINIGRTHEIPIKIRTRYDASKGRRIQSAGSPDDPSCIQSRAAGKRSVEPYKRQFQRRSSDSSTPQRIVQNGATPSTQRSGFVGEVHADRRTFVYVRPHDGMAAHK